MSPLPPATAPRFDRRVMAIALLAAAVAGLGFWWQASVNEDVAFLTRRGPGAWIVYPAPGSAGKRLPVEMETLFRRVFQIERAPTTATLHFRAFRSCEITLNGRPIPLPDPGRSWKVRRTVEVARYLVAGRNDLSVRVANANGPPALWLTLDAGRDSVVTDTAWQASLAGAAWRPAAAARGAMRGRTFDPEGLAERAVPALERRGLRLSLYAALVLGTFLGFDRLRRRLPAGGPLRTRSAAVVVLSVVVLWAGLLLHNAALLRRGVGFDWSAHLEYVSYILEHRTLPLADAGWQMYQPPLYYATAAALLGSLGFDPSAPGGAVALRVLNLAVAAANLLLVLACLRQIFPDRLAPQLLAFVLAGFLPPLLYLAHFPTGELLAVCLSTATFWLALRLARRDSPATLEYAALGACLGAALLAKFSALLLAPGCLGVLAYRLSHARRAGRPGLAMRGAAAALLAALLVCGWHYGRVWAHFGTPIVGNWDGVVGPDWWQDPGYRTTADYMRFGESLDRTAFAGFNGAWDGFYSTLWGDALYAGKTTLAHRPAWSHDLIAAGALLALLPSLAVLIGLATVVLRLLRRPSVAWSLLVGTGLLIGLALVGMSLVVPSYAQYKAFYGLIGLVPLVALGAVGLELLMGQALWRRALVVTLFGTWAITAYSAYWIDDGSAPAALERARDREQQNLTLQAETAFRSVVAIDPSNWTARLALAQLLGERGAPGAEIASLLEPGSPLPDLGERHVALARWWTGERQPLRALEHANLALERLPDSVDAHLLRAQLLWDSERPEESIAQLLEAVRCDPWDPGVHASVGRALVLRRRPAEAEMHCELALRLRPGFVPAEHCLGLALAVQRRYEEGASRLQQALALEPGNAEIRDDLRRVLQRIGDERTAEDGDGSAPGAVP